MIWLLHGFLGRASDWEPFVDDFAALGRGDVRRPDLFGPRSLPEPWALGPSDSGPGGLPAWGTAFAEEVRRVDSAPVLIGYSLGGRLALHALLADPSMWKAAILVSTHTGLNTEEERAARVTADEGWAARFESEPWASLVRAWLAQPVFGGRGRTTRLEESRFDRAALAAALRRWSLGRQENLLARLSALTLPVLWLAGSDDPKFVRVATPAVAELPAGRLAIIEGCAHRLPWEAPEAFRRHCREFLAL